MSAGALSATDIKPTDELIATALSNLKIIENGGKNVQHISQPAECIPGSRELWNVHPLRHQKITDF